MAYYVGGPLGGAESSFGQVMEDIIPDAPGAWYVGTEAMYWRGMATDTLLANTVAPLSGDTVTIDADVTAQDLSVASANVSGQITASSAHIEGNATVDGTHSTGTLTTTNLEVTGWVTGNFLPVNQGTQALGGGNNRWDTFFDLTNTNSLSVGQIQSTLTPNVNGRALGSSTVGGNRWAAYLDSLDVRSAATFQSTVSAPVGITTSSISTDNLGSTTSSTTNLPIALRSSLVPTTPSLALGSPASPLANVYAGTLTSANINASASLDVAGTFSATARQDDSTKRVIATTVNAQTQAVNLEIACNTAEMSLGTYNLTCGLGTVNFGAALVSILTGTFSMGIRVPLIGIPVAPALNFDIYTATGAIDSLLTFRLSALTALMLSGGVTVDIAAPLVAIVAPVVTCSGALQVSGLVSSPSGSFTALAATTLSISGSSDFGGNVDVTGDLSVGPKEVLGTLTGGNLIVASSQLPGGPVTGGAIQARALTLSGNMAAAGATFAGDVLPDATLNNRNLGLTTQQWYAVHAQTTNTTGNAVIGGTLSVTGTSTFAAASTASLTVNGTLSTRTITMAGTSTVPATFVIDGDPATPSGITTYYTQTDFLGSRTSTTTNQPITLYSSIIPTSSSLNLGSSTLRMANVYATNLDTTTVTATTRITTATVTCSRLESPSSANIEIGRTCRITGNIVPDTTANNRTLGLTGQRWDAWLDAATCTTLTSPTITSTTVNATTVNSTNITTTGGDVTAVRVNNVGGTLIGTLLEVASADITGAVTASSVTTASAQVNGDLTVTDTMSANNVTVSGLVTTNTVNVTWNVQAPFIYCDNLAAQTAATISCRSPFISTLGATLGTTEAPWPYIYATTMNVSGDIDALSVTCTSDIQTPTVICNAIRNIDILTSIQVRSDLEPSDNQRLGSTTRRWLEVFASTVNSGVGQFGTVNTSSLAATSNISADTLNVSHSVICESATVNGPLTVAGNIIPASTNSIGTSLARWPSIFATVVNTASATLGDAFAQTLQVNGSITANAVSCNGLLQGTSVLLTGSLETPSATITGNASILGSVLSTGTGTLGTSLARWSTLFATTVNATSATLQSITTTSLTTTALTITGALSAASITCSGALQAASATLTGMLTAAEISCATGQFDEMRPRNGAKSLGTETDRWATIWADDIEITGRLMIRTPYQFNSKTVPAGQNWRVQFGYAAIPSGDTLTVSFTPEIPKECIARLYSVTHTQIEFRKYKLNSFTMEYPNEDWTADDRIHFIIFANGSPRVYGNSVV